MQSTLNLSGWISTTIRWSGSLEGSRQQGRWGPRSLLKLQGRYRTVQQRLLLCVKFIKVLKVLPPFCDIPHELTHFAVTVDFANDTCNPPDQRFCYCTVLWFWIFRRQNLVTNFQTIVALIKTRPTLRWRWGVSVFCLQLSQPFNLS